MIVGHEAGRGILLVEIFVDNGRFVNDSLAVNQGRNFAVRIDLQKVLRFVFEIHFDELVWNLFFRQDNPCPVRVGSAVAGIKLHEIILLIIALLTILWA